MAKKLSAKIGEYTNQQGETKGRYANLGVVMSGQNGSYVLLDPTVSLAGILACQNAMAASKGEQQRDRVMVSVFEEQQNQAPQQNYQQPQQPPQQQTPQQNWDSDVPF